MNSFVCQIYLKKALKSGPEQAICYIKKMKENKICDLAAKTAEYILSSLRNNKKPTLKGTKNKI